MRILQKDNDQLNKIITDLQVDKLIQKESPDHLKLKAGKLMSGVGP